LGVNEGIHDLEKSQELNDNRSLFCSHQLLDQDRAKVFPAKFEKGTFDMQIVLDGRGLIAGLTFKPHAATKPEPEKHQAQLSQADRQNIESARRTTVFGSDQRESPQDSQGLPCL